MVTLEQLQSLQYRGETHHNFIKNADGSCQRWRKNGQLKTWKTRPGQFNLPVKNGLKNHHYITEVNAKEFHLACDCEKYHATSWVNKRVQSANIPEGE